MKGREFERLVLVMLPAFDVLVRGVVETEAGATDGRRLAGAAGFVGVGA